MRGRIVVCGGSGFIGSALTKKLISSGYEVAIVGRNPAPGEFNWSQLTELLEGSLAVVNLAGKSIACRFTEQNKREILESRIESARMVAEAINQCQEMPKKWINASATGFYGDCGDQILDESSPAGTTFSADVCVQWEKACLDSSVEIEKSVVRFGIVLSSKGGVLTKLIPLVKAFLGGTAGSGNQWISWIHLTDAVRLIEWAIENSAPRIVSASTPNPIQNRDFMQWLRKLYRRPWSPAIPTFMLVLVGKLFGPDASLVLESYRVVPTQLPNFSFDFPTLESISQSELEVG